MDDAVNEWVNNMQKAVAQRNQDLADDEAGIAWSEERSLRELAKVRTGRDEDPVAQRADALLSHLQHCEDMLFAPPKNPVTVEEVWEGLNTLAGDKTDDE